MANFRLVSKILRGAWLIDDRYAEGFYGRVIKLLSGEPVSFFNDDEIASNIQQHKTYALALTAGTITRIDSYDDAPEGSIAVLNYSGVVMKEDSCGIPGTDTMRNRLLEAYAHKNIGAVFLKMDSGGGSVDGTFEFADVVAQNKKPVISFISGMAASADYAIISGSHRIFASHKTTEIGSIGTATTLYNSKERLKQMGYEMLYINADSSPDKNQDYFKALEKDFAPIKQNILNPTNTIFQDTVKSNRSGKLSMQGNEPLTGKVYLAEKAIDLGLIDAIATEQDALNYALQISGKKELNQTTNNKMKVKLTSALKSLATFFNVNVAEQEQEVEITQDMLSELNARLEDNANSIAAATEKNEQLTLQINNLNAQVTELQKTIDSNKQTIEALNLELANLQSPGEVKQHPRKKDVQEHKHNQEDNVDPEVKMYKEMQSFDFEKTSLRDNPSFANQVED